MSVAAIESTVPGDAVPSFFAARRLGHVNLYVENVERAYAFYNGVLGLAESYTQPANKAAFLGNNNTHHDIAVLDVHGRLGAGHEVGLNHLAWELETEIDLVTGYDRALAAGVVFSATMDHDIAHSLYGRDPEGIANEIYADVIKDWRAARSGVVTKPKPKWAPRTTPPNAERNYHIDPVLDRVETAIFHPRRVVHATLVVADMKAALDYYERVVGLTTLVGGADAAFAILGGTAGEVNLALFARSAGLRPGYHHAGFELWSEAELDTSLATAKANGLAVAREVDHPARRSVFIDDSDGFRVQLFVDRAAPLASIAAVDVDTALHLA